jgi:hypothetical protein
VHAGAEEARAENDIGAADEDRRQEFGIFIRIVFEIGVLDERDVRRGFADAGSQGGKLPKKCSVLMVFSSNTHSPIQNYPKFRKNLKK